MADYQLPLLSYAQPSGSSTLTATPTQPSVLDQLKARFSNPKTWAMMAQSPYAGVISALLPAIGYGIKWLGEHAVVVPEGQQNPVTAQHTWDNSSWMRGGDITNPFGQNSYDSADAFASSFDAQFDGFDQEALRLGQPGSSYPGGGSMGGGYMGNPYLSAPSMSQVDMGNGMMMPVISGPQWTGPKGLPWTQGADPSSYPYSYIPPNGSWEGVNWFNLPNKPAGSTFGDGSPATGRGGILGGDGLHARSGSGGLLGGVRDVNFGSGWSGTGSGGDGSPGNWSNFSTLPSLLDVAY